MMDIPLQRQIEGKYEILDKIKEGGMGAIYRVRHRRLGNLQVVKVIRPQLAVDRHLRRRFEREARLLIRLRHPNVAQVYDYSVGREGFSFIAMEYIDGVTLLEMLQKRGPPSLGLALELARQSLLALSCLHHHHLVHRDISPDNLMLSRSFDGRVLVKLIDLGIAKETTDGGPTMTESGMFLGKVRYAAPEQFGSGGSKELDHRRDLYALGVLLYELLTGRYPFSGTSFNSIAASHLFNPPLDFETSDPRGRIPGGLRRVVLQALEKKPAQRIPSAEDFLERLEPFRAVADPEPDELDEILGHRPQVPAAPAPTPVAERGLFPKLTEPRTLPAPNPAAPDRSASGRDGWRPRWLAVAGVSLFLLVAAGVWLLGGGLLHRSPQTTSSPPPGPEASSATPTVVPERDPPTSPPGAAAAPRTGSLVLDALPWAEVRSILDSGGNEHSPPSSPFTPLHVALPQGTYTVSLHSPNHPEQVILVEIRPAESTRRVVLFEPVDEETYFASLGW